MKKAFGPPFKMMAIYWQSICLIFTINLIVVIPTMAQIISPEIQESVQQLLAKMTLEEKIGQMHQDYWRDDSNSDKVPSLDPEILQDIQAGRMGAMINTTSVAHARLAQEAALQSRLKIPLLLGYDVIHGFKTMFPMPIAEACSWNMQLIQEAARVAGREAAAAGINWTFAPMVDLSRDPRWGRLVEGAGEDPYLGSKIAVVRVKGFQGDDLSDPQSIAACPKHLAAYGFGEGGRDYATVEIGKNTLHNMILPPFKAAVDAGAASMMDSYNEISGLPTTGSHYLQTQLVKDTWGFAGFIVSDWGSIEEMMVHGMAADKAVAAEAALRAGTDIDMVSRSYLENLTALVEEKPDLEALIDDAVARILSVKFALGLFEDPFKYCDEQREKEELFSTKNRETALQMARESIVLLKNENQLLPIDPVKYQHIAMIGPWVKDKSNHLGNWKAQAVEGSAISVWEAVKKDLPQNVKLSYAKGVKLIDEKGDFKKAPMINNNDPHGIEEAIALAQTADLVIMVLGESRFQSAEMISRAKLDLPGFQPELLKAVLRANPNVVLVLNNGRPLALEWEQNNVPAIVESWFLGNEAGKAIADVLLGKYNPSGKLVMTFPRTVGQIPIYYNHKNTGRPTDSRYSDIDNSPLYPFGFGLSYTSFEYSNLELSPKEVGKDEQVEVSVTLKNTGNYTGEEVVQLYIQDIAASSTRPIKELKGFQKVKLSPNEAKTIRFLLSNEDLSFYSNGKWITEAGLFKVFVGGNSQDVLEASFMLND